jgi:hypothetical protein
MPSRRAQAAAADLRPLRPCFAPSCSLLSLSVLPASFLPVLRERATCAPFERAGPRSTHMHMLFYIHVAIDPARPQSTRTLSHTPHIPYHDHFTHIYHTGPGCHTWRSHTHDGSIQRTHTRRLSAPSPHTHCTHHHADTPHTSQPHTSPTRAPSACLVPSARNTHTHVYMHTHTTHSARPIHRTGCQT